MKFKKQTHPIPFKASDSKKLNTIQMRTTSNSSTHLRKQEYIQDTWRLESNAHIPVVHPLSSRHRYTDVAASPVWLLVVEGELYNLHGYCQINRKQRLKLSNFSSSTSISLLDTHSIIQCKLSSTESRSFMFFIISTLSQFGGCSAHLAHSVHKSGSSVGTTILKPDTHRHLLKCNISWCKLFVWPGYNNVNEGQLNV